MKKIEIIMGVPIIVEIVDANASEEHFAKIFSYFKYVDEKFSTYKTTSEITAINQEKMSAEKMSADMREVLDLAEKTKKDTDGFFDVLTPGGELDPSGVVKGWSIWNATKILEKAGVKNFFVEAGGDIQTSGKNSKGENWSIGIQNPFNKKRQVVKKVYLSGVAIATSGNYVRPGHIYNPKNKNDKLDDMASVTVIGTNILDADMYATAVFAMGKSGVLFIENLPGFEGYFIDKAGIATMTSGFDKFTKNRA